MKSWIAMAAVLIAAFVGIGWLKYRIETRRALIDDVMSVTAQCGRLAPGMTREEAVELMGAPVEERPALGARGPALRLKFKSPEAAADWPAALLDPGTSRVVEIVCSRSYHIVAPAAGR